MKKRDLDELERLANAATEGPWSNSTKARVDGECNTVKSGRVTICSVGVSNKLHDVRFIAAARQAIPQLIARIRELEEEVEYYKKQPEERLFLVSPAVKKAFEKAQQELEKIND